MDLSQIDKDSDHEECQIASPVTQQPEVSKCLESLGIKNEPSNEISGEKAAVIGSKFASIVTRTRQMNNQEVQNYKETRQKESPTTQNIVQVPIASDSKPPKSGLDDDSNEMLSFLWILRSWLLDCSAHGVPKVIASANFNRKIFWLCAVFVCAFCFVWQITDMFIDVYSYPITVNLQIATKDHLEFPTVTICNSNKLKESMVQSLHQDSDLYKAVRFEGLSAIGLKSIYDSLLFRVGLLNQSDVSTTHNLTEPTKCSVNRDYLGDKDYSVEWDYYYQYGYWYWDYELVWDYTGQVSPKNEFQCEDGSCVSQVFMCDGKVDCLDESDESPSLCGKCPANKFECDDGVCIDPKLRCNGEFDCPDGTDETQEFCDLSLNKDTFICCSSPRKVPLEHLCDGFDDCPADKSDQFLAACFEPIQNNVSQSADMYCPKLGSPYSSGVFSRVSADQLNDGSVDCMFGIDETCAWKNNLHNWVSPTESERFKEYQSFLELAKVSPASTRWYTMASKELIAKLGHKYEDLVLKCVANNKPCSQSAVVNQTVSQDYGNCFSFTMKDPATTSGRTYGLSLWFNLEVYDSLGFFTPNAGLKMYVTTPGERRRNGDLFVDFSSEINLAPGYEHSVSVQPTEIQKLPEPFSTCENYGEGWLENFNSKQQCLQDCTDAAKFEECGCVDDVSYEEAPLCTLAQVSERQCVDDVTERFNPSSECSCPNECVSKGYEIHVSQSEWPTNRSISRFITSVSQQLHNDSAVYYIIAVIEKFLDDKLENTQEALTHLRSNFGSMNVHFRDLSETIIQERPVYNFVMILSNFGGLLGLYLGFSVLTILELVDFWFDFTEYLRLRGKKQTFQKYLGKKDQESLATSTSAMSCETDSTEMTPETSRSSSVKQSDKRISWISAFSAVKSVPKPADQSQPVIREKTKAEKDQDFLNWAFSLECD